MLANIDDSAKWINSLFQLMSIFIENPKIPQFGIMKKYQKKYPLKW